MKTLITLLLFTVFGYGQNTILDKNRKVIKIDIKKIDIDSFMNKQPKGVYYIQKYNKGIVKECRLINKGDRNKKTEILWV